jgi:hypothetical protein
VTSFKKIASGLYQKMACSSEHELRQAMKEVLGRYFNTQTALK